jgi:hypothetical protein
LILSTGKFAECDASRHANSNWHCTVGRSTIANFTKAVGSPAVCRTTTCEGAGVGTLQTQFGNGDTVKAADFGWSIDGIVNDRRTPTTTTCI